MKFKFTRFQFDYFRIKIKNPYKFHITYSWIAKFEGHQQTLSFSLSAKTLPIPLTVVWDNFRHSFKHVPQNPLRICRYKTWSIQLRKFETMKLFSNLWKLYTFFSKRKFWNEHKLKRKILLLLLGKSNFVENYTAKFLVLKVCITLWTVIW